MKKPTEALSPREAQVGLHVVAGLSTKEISQRMIISEATVNTYIKRIFRKLQVNSRVALAVALMRDGRAANG